MNNEPPRFIIEVDTLDSSSSVDMALNQLASQRFYLKKSIYNEDKFKQLYKNCLSATYELIKSHSIFNTATIELVPSKYNSHYNLLSSFFPVSYATLDINTDRLIIMPYVWNYFILCNPQHAYVYIGGSKFILEHLYALYPDSLCNVIHYI